MAGAVSISCDPCDKDFTNDKDYQQHLQSKKHQKLVENFICKTCDTKFVNWKQLEAHNRTPKHERRQKKIKNYKDPQKIENRKVQDKVAKCECLIPGTKRRAATTVADTAILGSFNSLASLKKTLCKRFKLSQNKILFVERETKANKMNREEKNVCPKPPADTLNTDEIEEDVVVVIGKRLFHTCRAAFVIYGLVMKSSFPETLMEKAYSDLKTMGLSEIKEHRPSTDPPPLSSQCFCLEKGGRAYHFGCMFSEWTPSKCKYAKRPNPKKFLAVPEEKREAFENTVYELESHIEEKLKRCFPDIFRAMARRNVEQSCRLGLKEGLFSGISVNIDKCCHIHQDSRNEKETVTALVTLCPENSSKQVHIINSLGRDSDNYFGIILNNGDLMLEPSHRVYHSVTPALNPNLEDPSRISVVFFQHKYMDGKEEEKHCNF